MNIKNCFDIPFQLVCGDLETTQKIFNALKDKSGQCKESLRKVFGVRK